MSALFAEQNNNNNKNYRYWRLFICFCSIWFLREIFLKFSLIWHEFIRIVLWCFNMDCLQGSVVALLVTLAFPVCPANLAVLNTSFSFALLYALVRVYPCYFLCTLFFFLDYAQILSLKHISWEQSARAAHFSPMQQKVYLYSLHWNAIR